MSWMGKIVGGGLGMMFGGPLGAVVGAALGHTFVDSHGGLGGGTAALSQGETRQMVFFATTFAMLGKMAKADGKVSKEEIHVVETFINDRLGLPAQARDLAIKIFNQAKDNPTPFEDYAHQFGDVFAQDHQMRAMFFEILYMLAMADGTLHPAEDALLKQALSALRVSMGLYDDLRGKMPALDHHYGVLGISPGASDDEVKRAYRKAVQDYHPDKIIAKGLPEEFTKFAEEKCKEINASYEAIKAHRAGA
jgi:DnaJ like chaperone protein